MRTTTTTSNRRHALAAAALAGTLAVAVGACTTAGSDVIGRPATGPEPTAATDPGPTDTRAEADGGGIAVAPLPGDESPYTSAVTDHEVANPAFGGLGRDIDRRISAAGLPGASLLVLHDGALVEQEAFGSYTLDTVVPIASASKWLSGATIMSLVDDGLIDLDVPIRTYLPEATGPSGAITMRQLLSFTSGLEYDDRIGCYDDRDVTLAECNTQILGMPLLAPPGTGYRYTGTHLHVAAGVAERVTGQTWEQLFQERVAEPLGMTRTTFVSPLRKGAAPDGHPTPAGSAISTVGDYGRFLEMLVHDGVAPDGSRILSSEAIAKMGTNQIADARFVSAAANRKANETPYGLAHWLDVVDADGTAVVESSPGKFGFRPWIDHVNGIAGVYLVVDTDDEHVTDSPDRTGGRPQSVQTSGTFVVSGTAEALGGRMPTGRR